MGPKCGAFTLIELLTVVAIIGILCTLLMSVLGSAKKSSHRARCISNLHQISLSLHMYVDDFNRRPLEFSALVANRYLANPDALKCPSDKFGGWGSRIQAPTNGSLVIDVFDRAANEATPATTPNLIVSYLHPLDWQESSWQTLVQKGGLAGIAACQLHGLGHPDLESPSIRDFQGLVFRAQFDGAVVKRHVYWDYAATLPFAPPPENSALVSSTLDKSDSAAINPWQLFSDDPIP